MHEGARPVGMGRELGDGIDDSLGQIEGGIIEQKGNGHDSQNGQLIGPAVLQYVFEKIRFHYVSDAAPGHRARLADLGPWRNV